MQNVKLIFKPNEQKSNAYTNMKWEQAEYFCPYWNF